MSDRPEVLERTLHETHDWLNDLAARLGWEDRRACWRVLRVSLHMLRDRMATAEVAHLGAQMPTLLRGVYYEGWRPAGEGALPHDAERFLRPLADAFDAVPGFDAERAFAAVVGLLRARIAEGEMRHVRQMMPKDVAAIWDEAA
ncbi:MAG: DUF2267 domain-containing protein [Paracoccaceae bacterium]